MNDFIANNLWEVLGFVFVAATVLAGLRFGLLGLSSKIDEQTKTMVARFDALEKKDDEHDRRLNEHSVRITKAETHIEHQRGWLKEMRDQMREIYNTVVQGK